MAYLPPPLAQPVELATGYLPPDLALPVTLSDGAEPDRVSGTLLAEVIAVSPPVTVLATGEVEGPVVYSGAVLVTASAESPAVAFAGMGLVVDTDGPYLPPLLATPIQLVGGYTPPDLSVPIVLCEGGGQPDPEIINGTVQVNAPALPPGVTLSGVGHPVSIGSGTLIPEALAASVAMSGGGAQLLELPDNGAAGRTLRERKAMQGAAKGTAVRSQQALVKTIAMTAPHEQAAPLRVGLSTLHAQMVMRQRFTAIRQQQMMRRQGHVATLHAEALRSRQRISLAHAQSKGASEGVSMAHAETVKRRPALEIREQKAFPLAKALALTQRHGQLAGHRLRLRWTHGEKPQPGYWWPSYQPPGLAIVLPCESGYKPRPLHCDVVLGAGYEPQPFCPIDPPDPGTIIIPVRETYAVINELKLTELDGTPLQAEEFSASIDADSWTWSWSARIPASALHQVRPDSTTRVELIVTINGEPLRVLVENIQRERRFGEAWLQVSGRGRAAFLADPLAPVTQYTNTSAMTAQQALNATLTANGVPIGWTVDWQIEDWQIPAGTWSHNGTWIDAAKRIAEAGGAYVQSHDTDQTLIVLPRYPVAPWSWAAAMPDIQLPDAVVEVEGIEWQEKPDYNAVWVHGGDQGRADRIIRAGTGGTNPAPTIVDELATDPAMTRQRGLALLGDTGKQATVSLRLPVLPETGLIRPGQLVEYLEQGNTRRGLVRSLSVRHQFPETWQTIGVETHE